MKSKYTKSARKSGNKKSMKMRKTRKERKVRTRKMKPQVGGMKMDPLLRIAVEKDDGQIPIDLYESDPEKYWYLETRSILQDYIGDQVEDNDQSEYEKLLDVMDGYKIKMFKEFKAKLKAGLNLDNMSPEEKKLLTKALLALINPHDLENEISEVKTDPKTGEKTRKAITLQL